MKSNKLINSLVFILVFTTTLFASGLMLEEAVVYYLAYVEIDPVQFESNLDEALESAEFDFSIINELGLSGILPYIHEDVAPVGELIIPTVDIHLPIFHGVTEAHISLGAATLTPDQRMGKGNYALASHYMQWGMLFGSLDQVQIGDLIILRDDTYLYLYKAISNEVIDAYLVEIIDNVPDKTLITLITCTPGGEKRVAVQGEFMEQILISNQASVPVILADENFETFETIEIILEVEAVQFPWFEIVCVIVGALSAAGFVTWLVSKRS